MANGKSIVKAEVVSVRRTMKTYGRDCSPHFIISVGVRNSETGNVHYADLPLIYTAGLKWAFYDRDKKMSVERSITAKDTADAIAHARKVFPGWAEYVDALPEDAAPSEAFSWFDANANTGVVVEAAFTERTYRGADGEDRTAYEATLYEQFAAAMPTDFDAQFAKALRASNVKLGKAAKGAARPSAAATANPGGPAALAPSVPMGAATVAGGGKVYTKEGAWAAYVAGGLTKQDPKGEAFWPQVMKATGKTNAEIMSFTSDDWKKAVDMFSLPF